jgi:Leucine-rich repeat (LRR) protein
MSDDNSIKKDDKKILIKIEEICGPLNRVSMWDPTPGDNMFNINRDGNVIMLGLNLVKLKLEPEKIALLGEIINKFNPLEAIYIWNSEENNFPHWIKNIKKNALKEISINESNLNSIPEWLRECENLELLSLSGNNITLLPNWLLNFKNLRKLIIRANPIELNQENFNICKALKDGGTAYLHAISSIELYLLHNDIPIEHLILYNKIEKSRPRTGSNDYNNIKVKEGQIIEWQVVNRGGFTLESLPENFGILSKLQKLILRNSSIVSLPESFGEIEGLTEIDLSNNKLTSLPDSFVNLTSITKLDLSNNQFSEIPTQLWALKEITDLNLANNPFNPEDLVVSQKVPDLIREYLRKKATIKVFISHAVIDFEPYRIRELVEYLEKQKEISQVFFCEEDLAGNIDEWMLDNVQKSQLILFIGTHKSVFNSPDCANELQLADKFSIPVIPIKGYDVDWPDLAEINLSRELGLQFDKDNFDAFCEDLYKYVENFKREINLMEKEERRLGILDIYERFRLMLDEKFDEIVRKIGTLSESVKTLKNDVENLKSKL